MALFKGSATALITPFKEDKNNVIDPPICWDSLANLIERQIAGGTAALVPCGTTGESPTLTHTENIKVIRFVVERARDRVPIIGGTGANSTHEAVYMTTAAREAGADGTLQVSPYYNKPTQRGIIAHFTEIAKIGLPIILYNIPGRTASKMSAETIAELAKLPEVVALKEATGELEEASKIISLCRERGLKLDVYSGNDNQTMELVEIGAQGVISVAANIFPETIARFLNAILAGKAKRAEAEKLNQLFAPVVRSLFLETNPIPVKAAATELFGYPNVLRLPMTPMSKEAWPHLKTTLDAFLTGKR